MLFPKTLIRVLLFIFLSSLLQAQVNRPIPKIVSSKVESVILYRGQALVTRKLDVEDFSGSKKVIVSELPHQILPDSLFAEGKGIDVRAVRYRTFEVGEEPKEELKKIDFDIENVNHQIYRIELMKQVLNKRSQYLDRLENFVSTTASKDLSRGVLNATELEKLSRFSMDERKSVAEEILKWASQLRELQKELSLLQRKRRKLSIGRTRSVRQALVFLEKNNADKGSVRISYIVRGAGWSPSYNFRAQKASQEMELEYNAIIHQMSGENWQGVRLTLSTASPALSARGPGLAPFAINLNYSGKGVAIAGKRDSGYYSKKYKKLANRAQKASKRRQFSKTTSASVNESWEMNDAILEQQLLELEANDNAIRNIKMDLSVSSEGPSISYPLMGKVSLASRSDLQMVRIDKLKLPSTSYYVATPILTSYVYREAELMNNSSYALLAGPMNVYLNGNFVGRGEIPTVAQGQIFTIGLGADSQLRTKREFVKKEEKIQGGNKEIVIQYRLVLENYKNQEVSLRLYDRIPFPKKSSDVRVTLKDVQEPLSKDKLYLRLERPKGILRWDIEVPAKARGVRARLVKYAYKLEFDRNYKVSIPSQQEKKKQKMEFDDLESNRALR